MQARFIPPMLLLEKVSLPEGPDRNQTRWLQSYGNQEQRTGSSPLEE
jgi:hypothetical protein